MTTFSASFGIGDSNNDEMMKRIGTIPSSPVFCLSKKARPSTCYYIQVTNTSLHSYTDPPFSCAVNKCYASSPSPRPK